MSPAPEAVTSNNMNVQTGTGFLRSREKLCRPLGDNDLRDRDRVRWRSLGGITRTTVLAMRRNSSGMIPVSPLFVSALTLSFGVRTESRVELVTRNRNYPELSATYNSRLIPFSKRQSLNCLATPTRMV